MLGGVFCERAVGCIVRPLSARLPTSNPSLGPAYPARVCFSGQIAIGLIMASRAVVSLCKVLYVINEIKVVICYAIFL